MQCNRWGLLGEWLMLQTCTDWNKDQNRREFPETDDRAWHGSWRSTVKSIRDEDRIKWRQFCLENRKSTAYDRISSYMKRKVGQIAPDVGAFHLNKKKWTHNSDFFFNVYNFSIFLSYNSYDVCQKLPIWCGFFFSSTLMSRSFWDLRLYDVAEVENWLPTDGDCFQWKIIWRKYSQISEEHQILIFLSVHCNRPMKLCFYLQSSVRQTSEGRGNLSRMLFSNDKETLNALTIQTLWKGESGVK